MTTPQLRFVDRRPYGFVLLTWFLFLVVLIGAGATVTIAELPSIAFGYLFSGVTAVVMLLVVARLSWWGEVGLTGGTAASSRALYILPLLIVLRSLLFGVSVAGLGEVATLAGAALAVGFAEELFFRGLVQRALLPLGTGRAVAISVFLFGITHALNLLGGQNQAETIAQICFAFAMGFLFSALWLRTRSIWPVALLHALNNFSAWLVQDGINRSELSNLLLAETFIVSLVACVYAAILLRPVLKRA